MHCLTAALKRLAVVFLMTAFLAGCYSTGNKFATSGYGWLQPGISTAADVRVFLEADPVHVYRQSDGSSLQIWKHSSSLLPDGIYRNRELWLLFDGQDVLHRVVKKHNVRAKAAQ
ncbi:hypothetical protein L1889_04170 [Paenalcaligenes niemegkensis]|uniref:hypothetical protein n=1 Tax=Paenalcaligenes niemegkensis TaxID=2895469 RepID=UPI001EE927D2|nr:hypothetical protein [Paenalcaligenes niemegkensis]MCQ9615995.1 hypothetical protein [Paenalcaligenes niemegkensis]